MTEPKTRTLPAWVLYALEPARSTIVPASMDRSVTSGMQPQNIRRPLKRRSSHHWVLDLGATSATSSQARSIARTFQNRRTATIELAYSTRVCLRRDLTGSNSAPHRRCLCPRVEFRNQPNGGDGHVFVGRHRH